MSFESTPFYIFFQNRNSVSTLSDSNSHRRTFSVPYPYISHSLILRLFLCYLHQLNACWYALHSQSWLISTPRSPVSPTAHIARTTSTLAPAVTKWIVTIVAVIFLRSLRAFCRRLRNYQVSTNMPTRLSRYVIRRQFTLDLRDEVQEGWEYVGPLYRKRKHANSCRRNEWIIHRHHEGW